MDGRLSQVVVGSAVKTLAAVEAMPSRSHQHEFNGVTALKELFGESRRTFAATFLYLDDDEDRVVSSSAFLTWYDSRERHTTRSEFRLYFPSTDATERLHPGDTATFIRRTDDTVLVVFTPPDTSSQQQVLWLLGLTAPTQRVQVASPDWDPEVGFAAREILAQLGIETAVAPVTEESELEILLDRYGTGFPSTREFSAFARQLVLEADPVADPDEALMAWLEREEALFRQLEKHLVLQRLREGFAEDVDGFISYSLSIQNRRKSRVGHALENHIEAILKSHGVAFSKGPVTEGRSRPDFLFPSIEDYRDPSFPAEQLRMLGVKTTCKDRWRQILSEADRIERKHLLTLEPGLSTNQMTEMHARRVELVVPREIGKTLPAGTGITVLRVSDFVHLFPRE